MTQAQPLFRFAPSPNGPLHLGHALSAILNHDMAAKSGGRFVLRIEDIDPARSVVENEQAIHDDLAWLGLEWEKPVRRQSEHIAEYQNRLDRLKELGLVYPAFLSRGEVKAKIAGLQAEKGDWPRDPDGGFHYPGDDRQRSREEAESLIDAGVKHAWRLDMKQAVGMLEAPLFWREISTGQEVRVAADPASWGDVILWRSDAPSSYHLSVVHDDYLQGVSHVVRGMDLYHATSVQRLLQVLLGLEEPVYFHHRLVLGPDGRKLSKSEKSKSLGALRAEGATPSDIRRLVGL